MTGYKTAFPIVLAGGIAAGAIALSDDADAAVLKKYVGSNPSYQALSGEVSNGNLPVLPKESYTIVLEEGDTLEGIAQTLQNQLLKYDINLSVDVLKAKLNGFNKEGVNQFKNDIDVYAIGPGKEIAIFCKDQVLAVPEVYGNPPADKGTPVVDVCTVPCEAIDGTRNDGRLVPVGENEAVVSEIMNVKNAFINGTEYKGVKLTRGLAEGMVAGILEEKGIVPYSKELKIGDKTYKVIVLERDGDCIAFDGDYMRDGAREILSIYLDGGKTDDIFFDERLFSSTGNYIPGIVIIPNGVDASRISAKHSEKPKTWNDRTPGIVDDSDKPCEVYELTVKKLMEQRNGDGHNPGGPDGCGPGGPNGGPGHDGMLTPIKRNYVADAIRARSMDMFTGVDSIDILERKEINTYEVSMSDKVIRARRDS